MTKEPLPDYEMQDLRTFTSADAIAYVQKQTDTVILSYSAGKDSLAAWLQVRDRFSMVLPVFHYQVPGLRFIDDYLDYVEDKMDAMILRLPHPRLTSWLNYGSYQPPLEVALLHDYGLPRTDYDPYIEDVRKALKKPEAWVGVGTTQNDSANRRLTFKKFGMTRDRAKKFFPIGDFRRDDLIDIIRKSGVKLPPDYRIWGRSWDGFDTAFLEGMKKHYPKDYERVLECFPLAALESFRIEMRGRHPHG